MKFRSTVICIFLSSFSLTLPAQEFVYKKSQDAYFLKPKGSEKINKNISYYEAEYFENGYCIVSDGTKYGLVNSEGVEIIPLKYDKMKKSAYQFYEVSLNNNWGLIDHNDKFYFEPEQYILSWIRKDSWETPSEIKVGRSVFSFEKQSDAFTFSDQAPRGKEIFKVTPHMPKYFESCDLDIRDQNRCQKEMLMEEIYFDMSKWAKEDIQTYIKFIVGSDGKICDVNFLYPVREKYKSKLYDFLINIDVHSPGINSNGAIHVLVELFVDYKFK